MAMLHSYGPTTEELRETFARKAADGKQLLLVIQEVTASEMLIEESVYTRAVDSVSEIVPLLKEHDREYARVSLDGVMDLSGTFEEQSAQRREQLKTLLDDDTQKELADFYAARSLQDAQREWRAQPFYRRWLMPCPQAGV